MATLPSVQCDAGVWTNVSGSMVASSSYSMQTNDGLQFLIAEKSTEPLETDSRFLINPYQQIKVLFDNVPFWVKPVGQYVVTIQIQGAP